MKRKGHTPPRRSSGPLRETDTAKDDEGVPRLQNVSEPTFYRRRRKLGRLEPLGARRYRESEPENAEIKKMADSPLDIRVQGQAKSKTSASTAHKARAVRGVVTAGPRSHDRASLHDVTGHFKTYHGRPIGRGRDCDWPRPHRDQPCWLGEELERCADANILHVKRQLVLSPVLMSPDTCIPTPKSVLAGAHALAGDHTLP